MQYSMKLMQAGKNYRQVVTRMSLTTAQSHSGIKYSQLKLSYVDDLSADEAETMKPIGETVMASFQKASFNLSQDDIG
jgi:hypothetical protein